MSNHPSLSQSKNARPLPLVSMMTRLRSTPPHTLGTFSPACSATSMNWTGDDVELVTAAFTSDRFPHFQSGVMRVSSSVLLSTNAEDPIKRRRGIFIDPHNER